LSIDTAFKDYILQTKDIDDIISDFQELFPQYSSYSDDILTLYIDIAYYVVPAILIQIGFEMSYKVLLYAIAHLLVSQNVQSDGTTSSDDDRLSNTMSADGVSISYKSLGTTATWSEWEYFYGNTNYGKMILLLLKNSGIGCSWGAYVV